MLENWKALPDPVRARLEEGQREIEFKRGEFVYRVGDDPKGLYFVEEGLVGLTILGSSGHEHLLRFFRAGQFFGHRSLFSEETYHGTTVALEKTRLRFVPRASVVAALELHLPLYRELVQVLARELRRCEVQRVMILENEILPRVAQSVVYLKDLHPQHSWTRQEIANFCASTVSTVIKALARLEELGLIRQSGRMIEIIDRDALIALPEKDPA